ncbi:MAG: hypothetical protein ACLFPE_10945 [Bacteroidales bacterium]
MQNYRNVNVLVSYDNAETLNYLKHYRNIKVVHVSSSDNDSLPDPDISRGKKPSEFPYNLYVNQLMEHVKDGYVLVLDDDDMFMKPSSLQVIANHISGKDNLVFWRVQFPEGRVIPEDEYFGKPPVFWHFSGIGFAFHSKYIAHAQWDGWKGADFAVASRLYGIIPNKIYIDQVLTGLQRQTGWGGFGARGDKLTTE